MHRTLAPTDDSGQDEYTVLLPLRRRRRVLREIRSDLNAAGVRCEVRKVEHLGRQRKVLVVVRSDHVSDAAFERLTSWIYVTWGIRPVKPSAEIDPPNDEPDLAWRSTEIRVVVAWLVRREFLHGVADICDATGVRWDSRVERSGLSRVTVLTISGPGDHVKETVARLAQWRRLFDMPSGGG